MRNGRRSILVAAGVAVAAAVVVGLPNPAWRSAGLGHAADRSAPRLDLDWTASTAGDPETLLADEEGAVVIARDGEVTALDRQGDPVWAADVAHDDEIFFHDLPSIGAGLVVVPVDEQRAVVLDRANGTERWRAPHDGVTSTGVGSASDGTPIVALVDRAGTLLVLDGHSGASRWSAQLPVFNGDQLAHLWIDADRVLVQWTPTDRGARFAAFEALTGRPAWERDLPAASLPSVVSDAVLFAESTYTGNEPSGARAQALDLASGEVRWATDFPTRSLYATPFESATDGDAFAIVDLHGRVRLYAVEDGAMRWSHATRRKQYEADLRIAGDVVAMSTYGTGLVALSTSTGRPVSTEPVGRVQLGTTIDATAAAGDRLYLLVSENGPVPRGGEVWSFRAGRSGPS